MVSGLVTSPKDQLRICSGLATVSLSDSKSKRSFILPPFLFLPPKKHPQLQTNCFRLQVHPERRSASSPVLPLTVLLPQSLPVFLQLPELELSLHRASQQTDLRLVTL